MSAAKRPGCSIGTIRCATASWFARDATRGWTPLTYEGFQCRACGVTLSSRAVAASPACFEVQIDAVARIARLSDRTPMPERPSLFAKRFTPITVQGVSGTQHVEVKSYLSGSPWNKKFNRAVLWDLRCFLKRRERYKDGAHGADHHSWHNDRGLDAYGVGGSSYFTEWLTVPMTWKQLQLAFYGKGTPEDFRNALTIIDYYLFYADMHLSSVHWSRKVTLAEYAGWYLGIDCNGFTGAYLKTFFPGLGIGPNDHINYLDSKLKKRADLAEVQPGDILSREGGSGTRHVAMIDGRMTNPFADGIAVSVTHSSGSYNGLSTQFHTLKHHPKSSLKWELAGYYKFDHCLAPEAK
jgi:hypothetical protein